jgi:CRISPR type III-B/RAMP module-associated protein Cmr5
MTTKNIDHARAERAYDDAKTNIPEGDHKTAKRYRTVVLSAPMQLRQVGLLQLAAFWLSKKEEERKVLGNILSWLKQSETAREVLVERPDRPAIRVSANRLHEVMEPLLMRNSSEIALLEAEAEAYLGWLKRLTEGRYKMLYKSGDKTQPAGGTD